MRNHMRVRLNFFNLPSRLQSLHDLLARHKSIEATEFGRYQIEIFETCRQTIIRWKFSLKLPDVLRHRPFGSFRTLAIVLC